MCTVAAFPVPDEATMAARIERLRAAVLVSPNNDADDAERRRRALHALSAEARPDEAWRGLLGGTSVI
ncbi:MAG TPA: hypothetical protein VFH51_08135 [Myxococcota bacterium]|nr:hypothetical protein [Myxococcota bacterium]